MLKHKDTNSLPQPQSTFYSEVKNSYKNDNIHKEKRGKI